jgi:hypothetical protein
MELTGGARLAVTAGRSVIAGLRKLEEETVLANTPRPRRPGWAECARTACGRKGGRWGWPHWEAEWAGWPLGWLGQKQGKMISELKIGFLNLSRLWKFVEGDLGGILTW